MAGSKTREALLEHGALLFARHGVAGVTARQLHEAIGARNESALHYHFGDRDGLALAILRVHLEAVEGRRAPLAAAIEAEGRTGDLRSLVHAFAAPMAHDLDTVLGRAHLRLVARMSHPSLAYKPPFVVVDAPGGKVLVRWLWAALDWLPNPVAGERLVTLRSELVSLFGLRAQLLDDRPPDQPISSPELFLENLVDQLVAGLAVPPSPQTLAAATTSPCAEPAPHPTEAHSTAPAPAPTTPAATATTA